MSKSKGFERFFNPFKSAVIGEDGFIASRASEKTLERRKTRRRGSLSWDAEQKGAYKRSKHGRLS